MTTTARKTTTKAATVSALPKPVNGIAVKQPFGVPAGRLLELQQETVTPEPYVVTSKIVIEPPTKARADRIREQQMTIMVAQTMLNTAVANPEVGEEVLNAWGSAIKAAQDGFTQALFGDQYQDVLEFFATQDDKLWQAFERDIQERFFPAPIPAGACKTCGHVTDEDAAGKE